MVKLVLGYKSKMSRRSKILERYPKVDPGIVNGLFDRDPSRGAYGEWMVTVWTTP